MNNFSRMALALALMTATTTTSVAQEAEDAFRIRTSIYDNKKLVTTATAVGVLNRTTTVNQTFSTPYQRDIALNGDGKSAEDLLEGRITISVRPFNDGRSLCLNVNIKSDTVDQLHHYRSDALLEVLPSGGSYLSGGDYCDSKKTDEGLLFDLSLGEKDSYGEILITPEKPVQGAG